MDARAFIRAKRDRGVHAADEIHAFVMGALRGEVRVEQISAWLMAAFLNGLDPAETDALTQSLVRSGRIFDWTSLGRPSADKHSTGGVGDKITLVLAPLVAACGVIVPSVAGRGLGHTGGTLDKLEAIPGFRGQLDPEALRAQLEKIGVALVGQGPDLAPADGLLYALRDATSTVEFEPFIVSSIVSKKVAEGAQTLVYDVKCGNGAFITSLEGARRLARRLVDTTRAQGRGSAALLTDMSQPLGVAAGNALEVAEAIATLRGEGPPEVRELTLELGTRMLMSAGSERTEEAARATLERTLERGEALRRFEALVESQGGDPRVVDDPDRLPRAPVTRAVLAERDGWLSAVDTFGLGELGVSIGAGRRSREQPVDPRVGFRVFARVGDRVSRGQPVAEAHLASDRADVEVALRGLFTVREEPVSAPRLVIEAVE